MEHDEKELGTCAMLGMPINGLANDIDTLRDRRIVVKLLADRDAPIDNRLVLLHEHQFSGIDKPLVGGIEAIVRAV